MKIAITATTNKIDQPFNPRFGRTEYFIIYDTETKEWEASVNPAANARGGAGPQAVQFITQAGAEIVISGRYGPNAFSALQASGLPAYIAAEGTVEDVIQQFLDGKLEQTHAATGGEMHEGH
ncbi:MAG TPA: dinitrogenase iron-molybdenum cofactor biosynthesis protein [Anaerolineales bacterium]|nr:dinitrogenase iron-molybdenum cofactor biosynthesis protein [Anaerolineales bacterium]